LVGLLTKKKVVPAGGIDGPGTRSTALTAAAVPINLGDAASWQMFKLGDHRWQWEAWRHYDICGEMRFVVNWVGQAISRCRMYAAPISDDGVVGEEVDDPRIKTIAETMFGTPASKAQAQRLMGINMMVAGDVFVVAEGYQGVDPDKWYIASSSEVYRRGDDIMVRRSITHGGGQYKLDPQKDLLIRAWNPHPRRYDAADSTVRAILPVLRELEQCTKRVFAELDSRLAGAGILLLPDNIDFPRPPSESPGDPRPAADAAGFSQLLMETMATSMQQRDSAAAIVPIILQVATEALDKIKHLTFDSTISDHISEMRKAAVERMAMSLDIPPEVLTGSGKANHWSSWQIEESSIKVHIEPLLIQLADALNIGYFQPALKAAGVQNPEKYTLWFDVSPLAVRPNRSDQAMQYAEKEYISAKAARDNAAFTDDDAPDDKELQYNLVKALVLAQPAYAGDPEVQKILGLPHISMPAPPAPPAAPGDLMPGDPGYDSAGTEPADAGTRGLPQLPSVADAEQGNVGPPKQKLGQIAASAEHAPHLGRDGSLFFAADAAVRRALELAGGRLVPGPRRAMYAAPKHELHVHVRPEMERVPSLLAGAWQHLREQAPGLSVDPDALEQLLAGYCTELLTRGVAHEAAMLRSTLDLARVDLAP
jgi:hypothetical protein